MTIGQLQQLCSEMSEDAGAYVHTHKHALLNTLAFMGNHDAVSRAWSHLQASALQPSPAAAAEAASSSAAMPLPLQLPPAHPTPWQHQQH